MKPKDSMVRLKNCTAEVARGSIAAGPNANPAGFDDLAVYVRFNGGKWLRTGVSSASTALEWLSVCDTRDDAVSVLEVR